MARRKSYSDEYKQEAVALSHQPGATVRGVAQDLGINEGLLGKWRRQFAEHGRQAFPGHGNARDEEIARLKRELARVTKERDFLRDAAAFFAKESK